MTNRSKLADLPANWWMSRKTSEVLIEWFGRHLIALYYSVSIDGIRRHEVYSGFVAELEDNLYWFTAGHVIDEIQSTLKLPNVTDPIIRWLDGYRTSEAASIPLSDFTSNAYSATKLGIDFGSIRIPFLEAQLIRSNGRSQIFTTTSWKNAQRVKPEGYMLLGYPETARLIKETPLSDGTVLNAVTANQICLPVRRIRRRAKLTAINEFWNGRGAFFGKILPYLGESEVYLDSVKGMSGGPLLSIERDPSNEIRYRLIGIQRSELRSELLIRVEPIVRAISFITK